MGNLSFNELVQRDIWEILRRQKYPQNAFDSLGNGRMVSAFCESDMIKKSAHSSFRAALAAAVLAAGIATSPAPSVQELANQFKQLPTVPEDQLPPMKNERGSFTGLIEHEGLQGHTWVRFPFIENAGSLGIDRKGRIYVAEANRFWLGTPDLRGASELVRGDFQSVAVEDRQKLYDAHPGRFPEGWFTAVPDRVIRLEDRDGNGAADHRTLFSDHFKGTLDGIGFSILPEDDAVYFTCIPNLWKMTDSNDDGIADTHEAIVEGFGARVSFIGHDLHGITRGPDGMLYFSVGDRGYHVTDEHGKVHSGPGRGAIFRCESDGSGFEVFCNGLRNPQELAFDDFGNLFTFDNTGDIGDLARMVYALEGSDSGWDMAHQSAHHYVTILDWEKFHPAKSMWVAERMFDTYNEEQPQWVYPPASHVARGPSGVTFLTGASLPDDLRGKFLLANYRGPSENCTVLTIGVGPKGAGYHAVSEEVLVKGVGVSDVELGFDGNIYLSDFGGGWSINENASIQVVTPKDEAQRKAGERTKAIFARGLGGESVPDLVKHLASPDKRLRQAAQFELVQRGKDGRNALERMATDRKASLVARLHGIWGLGQIGRAGGRVSSDLLKLAKDSDAEIRANVARTLGTIKERRSRRSLLAMLQDKSPRVRSLAAIALSRVAKPGDRKVIDALYALAEQSGAGEKDMVLRHACLSAIDRIGTEKAAVARATSKSDEVRLTALLYLRRHASAELVRFLGDESELIRREAVRAIYDTKAMDGAAGVRLAALGSAATATLPETVQRRIVAANYRKGGETNARRLMAMAGDTSLSASIREAALHGLRLWEKAIDTDPVLGHYRPQVNKERTMAKLGSAIGGDLKKFLADKQPANLTALALKLADESGVQLEESTLRAQISNTGLEAEVRVAALDSLTKSAGAKSAGVVSGLLSDKAPAVSAAAISHAFALKIDGIGAKAKGAIKNGSLPAARAGIAGLAATEPKAIADTWQNRESSKLRKTLWLDLFLALQESSDPSAKKLAETYAASSTNAVFSLSQFGGDAKNGESIFRNQGACMQCHKVGGDGGIQGPDLSKVGERLKRDKIVESLVYPGAVIAEGFGSSGITLKDSSSIFGRIEKEENGVMQVVGLDGKKMSIKRADVQQITPPISAMPPLGAALPPRELRDLVAFLANRAGKGKSADAASHGEGKK